MPRAADLGEEERGEADGLGDEDLVIAAVGEQGVPFEDHEESHDGHGERDEHVAYRDQAPPGEGQRPEEEDEEGAGGGEDAKSLNDSRFGLSLRGEGFRVEKAVEEVAHQRGEGAGRSRDLLPLHVIRTPVRWKMFRQSHAAAKAAMSNTRPRARE